MPGNFMRFHGIFMRISWENLAPSRVAMGHHGRIHENFMGFYEIFHENFTRPQSHGIRLLDTTLYKGNPDQAAPVPRAGSNSMGCDFHRKSP
jgi:hypothetical protein